MAGDEVRVKVGKEDVANLEAGFLRISQVLLNIALWVDDDGRCTGLVSEQIGSVSQAAQVVLFQNHRNRYSLPRPGLWTYFGAFRLSEPAAVRSSARAPARIPSRPILPSWQAYS